MLELNNTRDAEADQQHGHDQADDEYHNGSEAEFLHLAPQPTLDATLPDGPFYFPLLPARRFL